MNANPTSLVFDIETVPDGQLIASTKYPDENLSPEQAIERMLAETVSKGKPMIPTAFQRPIVIVVAQLAQDFSLVQLQALDEPKYRRPIAAHLFWEFVRNNSPRLITYNGRSFDIPVMEAEAMRYGLSAPDYWDSSKANWQQARGRYAPALAYDLQEVLSNGGAANYEGGMNRWCKIVNLPGKGGVEGSQVYPMWQAGRLQEIADYCKSDVLNTYLLFIRQMQLSGEITHADEQRHRRQAYELSLTIPALVEWSAEMKQCLDRQ